MFKNYKSNMREWIIIDDDFEANWNGTWLDFFNIYEARGLNVAINIIFAAKSGRFGRYGSVIEMIIERYPKYKEEIEKYSLLI